MMTPDAPAPFATLDRDELRARLARGGVKLVMASSDWGFRAKHLPGSLHFPRPEQMLAALGKDDEIVVYCSNADCHASLAVIEKLVQQGYRHVSHYPGGIVDWETAGLPLEGDWAGPPGGGG
jgi:rhodanese-related sulfurtransferase